MIRSTLHTLFNPMAAACAVAALAATGTAHADRTTSLPNIVVTGADDICTSFTSSVSGSSIVLACNRGTNPPPPPGAPTGCTATINGGASASLSVTGGSVNLAVGCASPASGISYNWARNGVSGTSSSASWTDTLPGNTVSTQLTYSYQVNACVGSLCTGFLPVNPLTAVVAGTSGPVPGPWPGVCDGFSRTIALTMNWAAPTRLFTASYGNMGPNDVVVVAFTTGSASTPNNNLARIAAAEYGTGPSTREAVLSAKPCDFGPQALGGAVTSGTSVTVPFAVGTGANFGYYPLLETGKTYYFNIKNSPNASCMTTGLCDIAIDLSKPAGL